MFEENIIPETPAPKKRGRQRKVVSSETMSNIDKEKIDRQLKDIYQDDSGKLPNMKEFKRASKGSFIGGLFKFVFSMAILAALVWTGFLFLPSSSHFDNSQVDLKIEGPQNFVIGATTTYNVVFKNKQNVNLNKVSLTINYPQGFVYSESTLPPNNVGKNEWDIGTLKPDEEKTLQITGNSFGSLGAAASWRTLLNYTPENFNSEMQKIATLDVKPDQAPISVAIAGLDKVAVGSTSTYTITINSSDNLANKNLIVTPTFPANFIITSSSLPMDKNVWNIKATTSATSTPVGQYTITFAGQFKDDSADTSALKVQVSQADQASATNYLLAESTLQTELIKNAVIINTAINGSLTDFDSKPGEILNFTLAVKNAGKDDISNAKVQLLIDSPSFKKQSILAWSNIADKNDGDITGSQLSDTVRRATLLWNKDKNKDLSTIKTGGQTNIDFQLPLKASDQAPWSSVDGYQIFVTTTLTYTDKSGATQTIVGNSIIITLNSDLAFKQKNDISANSKELEKHDISWILSNTYHALKNATLSADLFGDITFSSASNTPAGTLQFDQNSKHLTWTIPDLTENSDILAIPFSVILNKKDPTQNTLISKVHIQAQDSVTGKQLELTGDEVPLNN